MNLSDKPEPGDTAEFGPLDTTLSAPVPLVRMSVECAAESHRGLVREINEDHYQVVRFGRFLEPILSNLPPDRRTSMFREEGFGLVVADGMGGAKAGEVASEMAIEMLIQLACETPDWILSNDRPQMDRVLERMQDRFRNIDLALMAEAARNPDLHGMATTMTLAANLGVWLFVVHVGDSRAYLYHGGRLHRLTRDHTIAQEMIDAGIVHFQDDLPKRWCHTLTRVLGGADTLEAADIDRFRLADKDRVLLCSDGLTGMVPDDAIASILGRAPTTKEACQNLISAALQAGGRDNVTVIVAQYALPPSTPPPAVDAAAK